MNDGGKIKDPDDPLSTIAEARARLRLSKSAAYRLFRQEPGALIILPPGYQRPKILVPESVIQRVLRRSAVPERLQPRRVVNR